MSFVKNMKVVSYVKYGNIAVVQVRILKGADVEFEFTEVTPNTEQANYMVHTKGSVTGYSPTGEVLGTRTAGETTDTSAITWPVGIVTIKADTEEYEYLCISKQDESRLYREEHHLTDAQELTITNDTKVLVLISGVVRLNGLDFTGPEVIEIKSPSVRLVSVGNSFVSKVS
jgi:hypothetical protein